MARHVFGDTPADYTVTTANVSGTANVVVLAPSATITMWTQRVGGVQVTDLSLDENGSTPVTSVTTSDGTDLRAPGMLPTFYGPDEVWDLWAAPNDGPRVHLVSPDVATLADRLTDLAASLQSHTANLANPHQTAVSNLFDANIPAAPSAGDVLTYGNDSKWTNLAPSQVAGAVLLNPPLSGGTWAGNVVTLPAGGGWASQGSTGLGWTNIYLPYSAGDNNPDLWQVRSRNSGDTGWIKTNWANGNGELRTCPSSTSRIGFRAFELWEDAGGPSHQTFFECSTNPTDTSQREKLLATYGTGHSTKAGWTESTRVMSALKGVSIGGGFGGLAAINVRGYQNSAGAPTSGTWSTADAVVATDGLWVCTSGGTPGTWWGGPTGMGAVTVVGGGKEGAFAITATTGATTVDLTSGNVCTLTLQASTTLTLSGATAGKACSISLYVVQDATGSRLVTWPASVKWPNAAAPSLSTGANKVDLVVLETLDGGTTWRGALAGADFR